MNVIKTVLLAALLTVPFMVISQTKGKSYSLTGIVKGIPDGEVVLNSYDLRTRTSTKVNTGKLKNGKFVLKGDLKMPEMMNLVITPGNWSTQIFVENSAISVIIDTTGAQHYSYGTEKGASLKNVKVTGSKSHADFGQYQLATSGGKGRDEVFSKQLEYIKPFIAENPSSVAGLYMLSNHYMFNSQMPLAELEGLLAQLKGEPTQSLYFSNIKKEIEERKSVLPGNMVADFTLLKPDSTKFTLSSLKGKYVLIDFWASWCKPCREAIPHWKEVYTKYKDKGFEIVGVTNDSRWADWKKAMEQEQMPWIQVADEFPLKNMPARVISKYKHGTIPLYVLLDKDGTILVKSGDKNEIDNKLSELMGG